MQLVQLVRGTRWVGSLPAGWERVWGEQGRSWLGLWGSVGLKDVKAAAHRILDFTILSFPLTKTLEYLTTYAVATPYPHPAPVAGHVPIFALAQPLQASGKHG